MDLPESVLEQKHFYAVGEAIRGIHGRWVAVHWQQIASGYNKSGYNKPDLYALTVDCFEAGSYYKLCYGYKAVGVERDDRLRLRPRPLPENRYDHSVHTGRWSGNGLAPANKPRTRRII